MSPPPPTHIFVNFSCHIDRPMPRESIPIKVNYVASDNMISFVMRHAMAEDPCSYAYVYHDMVIFDD